MFFSETVFGCNLTKLAEREKSNVPQFMLHFMDHIEKKGLQVVGIYRLSGNAAEIQKLRYLVEQGRSMCAYIKPSNDHNSLGLDVIQSPDV